MNISRNAPCPCGSDKKYKKCCLPHNPTTVVKAESFQPLPSTTEKPKRDEDLLIVAMPTRGSISVETHLALTSNMDGTTRLHVTMARKPVVEARNLLAASIHKLVKESLLEWIPRETFVLWCDDDAWWAAGTVKTALSMLRELPAIDLLAGWFGGRNEYSEPIAWRSIHDGASHPNPGVDCLPGEIVEVARVGLHWVMHRASLLERLGDNPFSIPEGSDVNVSEDFAFCDRVRAAGGRIGVATGIPIAHVDPKDGAAYFVGMPATEIDGNSVLRKTLQHQTLTGERKFSERRAYGLPDLERAIAEADAKDSKRAQAKRTVAAGADS